MAVVLATNWWSLFIRGLLAILLAVIAFTMPGIALAAVVLLFAAYALFDGIFSIVGAWHAVRAHERWGVLVAKGILGIIAAAVTVLWPVITLLVLVYIIAGWAVVTGFLE